LIVVIFTRKIKRKTLTRRKKTPLVWHWSLRHRKSALLKT